MEESMIGVVLWSDISDRKAVIWCEDQGDLAFLNSQNEFPDYEAFFDAGDVVQFDMEVKETMRHAHNPRLVVERAGAALPEALRDRATSTGNTRPMAQIIPFTPRKVDVSVMLPRVSEA
ncbi:MAG: hypothetical protein R8G34_02130 [Paracoccaceae bacterium]|nr:hypothetical protein [Paracoccaceae bacterium]